MPETAVLPTVDDAAQLDDMCRRLLANPLIEDYEIIAGGA